MKYCIHCGKELSDEAAFCLYCGKKAAFEQEGTVQSENRPTDRPVEDHTVPTGKPDEGAQGSTSAPGIFKAVTTGINSLSGGEGDSMASLKDLVSDIFKKHTSEDSEKIFICGTDNTTPKLSRLNSDYPKPWLYSRVLLVFAVAFFLLDMCCRMFDNLNALPGVIFMGSFMIPIALVVLFFELNITKNISLLNVIKLFIIGGGASLFLTLILYEIIPFNEMNGYAKAILIGIIEEIGKLGIVYLFIKKEPKVGFLVNALMIGAAVGAGFAAFESAGYAFTYALASGYDGMMEVIILRAVLAPGGHIVWAAMSGFAVMNAKGSNPLNSSVFGKSEFWKLFWIPIALHAIWDMPIEFGSKFYCVQIVLTVISWVVILVLIDRSFKQVTAASKAAKTEEENERKESEYVHS